MEITINNNSDNCTIVRDTIVSTSDTGTITISGATSCITPSQNLGAFSGYFPRLIPGENNLTISSNSNVAVFIRTPVARWIT